MAFFSLPQNCLALSPTGTSSFLGAQAVELDRNNTQERAKENGKCLQHALTWMVLPHALQQLRGVDTDIVLGVDDVPIEHRGGATSTGSQGQEVGRFGRGSTEESPQRHRQGNVSIICQL